MVREEFGDTKRAHLSHEFYGASSGCKGSHRGTSFFQRRGPIHASMPEVESRQTSCDPMLLDEVFMRSGIYSNYRRQRGPMFCFSRRPEAESSDAVTICIVPVFHQPSYVLFDPGSTFSYMSTYFATEFYMMCGSMPVLIYASSPVGDLVSLVMYDTWVDLIILWMVDFYIILGEGMNFTIYCDAFGVMFGFVLMKKGKVNVLANALSRHTSSMGSLFTISVEERLLARDVQRQADQVFLFHPTSGEVYSEEIRERKNSRTLEVAGATNGGYLRTLSRLTASQSTPSMGQSTFSSDSQTTNDKMDRQSTYGPSVSSVNGPVDF
ncbi:hypothetical protein MTR67_043540 [Solanum verrucosum]|uniref:Uncharacterized protein n=1 Tax=Solanum verrucosum TaxID=315347 RepID=A0AAF0UP96_SOLVR|nr:hypothetical protein MTR67_043540 [Solanum verrucosum]